MTSLYRVNDFSLGAEEKKLVLECLDTGWISSEGPFVKEFETKFADFVSRKYGIAVTNGTAALDLSVAALEIKKGDEVIVPTFTIISCVLQLIRVGAIPVFVDLDEKTWNMNIEQIEEKITIKTKAIMMVHIYSHPVDIDKVLNLAKKYDLKIIEDAAEMIGQKYKDKYCGSFGDISTFSFYPNKHITTGEGGMVLTNSEKLAEKCRSLRNLAFKKEERFVHDELGWNLRMTNLQAALGLGQLSRIDKTVLMKRKIGEVYTSQLNEIQNIVLSPVKTHYSKNIYWVFGVLLDSEKYDKGKIIEELMNSGIQTRPFFCPMHMQPVLKKYSFFKNEKYPIAEKFYKEGFYLPSGLSLSQNDIIHICTVFKNILKKFG